MVSLAGICIGVKGLAYAALTTTHKGQEVLVGRLVSDVPKGHSQEARLSKARLLFKRLSRVVRTLTYVGSVSAGPDVAPMPRAMQGYHSSPDYLSTVSSVRASHVVHHSGERPFATKGHSVTKDAMRLQAQSKAFSSHSTVSMAVEASITVFARKEQAV